MEPLNENNPIVQDLMNASFSLEKSIYAVEKYETLDAALDYLQGEEDDNKGEAVIPVVDREIDDLEDSQDSAIIEGYGIFCITVL